MDLVVQNARLEGHLDSGIVDMRANLIELQGAPKVRLFMHLFPFGFCICSNEFCLISATWQTVHVDQMSGASTVLFTFTLDRGITWEVCSSSCSSTTIFAQLSGLII